jgi:hypothetical protein
MSHHTKFTWAIRCEGCAKYAHTPACSMKCPPERHENYLFDMHILRGIAKDVKKAIRDMPTDIEPRVVLKEGLLWLNDHCTFRLYGHNLKKCCSATHANIDLSNPDYVSKMLEMYRVCKDHYCHETCPFWDRKL